MRPGSRLPAMLAYVLVLSTPLLAAGAGYATDLAPDGYPVKAYHAMYAYTYVDFLLNIDSDDLGKNLEVDIRDVSQYAYPENLEVYLHEGDVPKDPRKTPHKVTTYTDRSHRAYGVGLNAAQLTNMTYHMVIFAGPHDLNFSIAGALTTRDHCNLLPASCSIRWQIASHLPRSFVPPRFPADGR